MMIDHYSEAFSQLLDLVRERKKSYDINHQRIRQSFGAIINLGDNNFSQYADMVAANEISASSTIESIAVNLFIDNAVPQFSYYPIPDWCANLPAEEQAKARPLQIVLSENGETTGIAFAVAHEESMRYERNFKCGKYKVERLIIVRLISPDADTYDIVITHANAVKAYEKSPISYMTLREFWEKHFGAMEYSMLVEAINQFNDLAQDAMGFNTVVTPTEETIARFRKVTGEMLQGYAYSEAIPSDVYQRQIDQMLHNYLERGLWKAMIGNCNFAISFITSEWYYKMHVLTENFDLTWVAAGYLKSVEQLLYAVIELSKGKGIAGRSKDHWKQDSIEFTKDTEESIDTTLGGLEWIIKNNRLLDVNRYAQWYITSTIDDWRSKSRNGYFHKDVIKSTDQVDEIRSAAIQLYFLILGSFTIRDDQFVQLGIQ